MAINNRNFFSHSSGVQKSEIKVLTGSCSLVGRLFPVSGEPPWLTSTQSLTPFSHSHLFSLCVSPSCLVRTFVLDLKPTGIIQDDLVLGYLITSAKSLILNEVTFVQRCKLLGCECILCGRGGWG